LYETQPIRIRIEIKEELKKLKANPKETYDEVLTRIINEYKKSLETRERLGAFFKGGEITEPLIFALTAHKKKKLKRIDGIEVKVSVKKEVEELVEALTKHFDYEPTTLRSILILYGISSLIWGGYVLLPLTKEEYITQFDAIKWALKTLYRLDVPGSEEEEKKDAVVGDP
jgi:hypothetical protein